MMKLIILEMKSMSTKKDLRTIICTKCGEKKPKDNFWFDKRRNKYQTPCKQCRNEHKRMRRREAHINGRFTKSELEKSYRLKGIPSEFIDVITANILLGRELQKVKEIKITGNNKLILIYCPVCSEVELIKAPVTLKDLIELGKLFENQHERCRKK